MLQEENFEWGNPSAEEILPEFSEGSMESKLAHAAYRWRSLLNKNKEMTGAFHGMRAIIHSSKERQSAFSRLIVAGGGVVDEVTR